MARFVFRGGPFCCTLRDRRTGASAKLPNEPSMQTFECPKCGAPVSYEPNALVSGAVKCAYCHSQLALPHHGQPARIISQIDINVGPQVTAGARKLVWFLVLVPLVIVIIVVAGVFGALTPVMRSVGSAVGGPSGGGLGGGSN